MRIVEEVPCTTASEFLDVLSPRSARFEEMSDWEGWLFRGHANAKWPLQPAIFRQNVEDSKYWDLRSYGLYNELVERELRLLFEFFWRADASGLHLPEDSQALRASFEIWRTDRYLGTYWPPPQILSLMALAQHHGVPTRLLDWSRTGYKAAYFAAVTAAGWNKGWSAPSDGPTHLAVWALSGPARHAVNFAFQEQWLTRVTAPRSGNPNLHAQDGVFTLVRYAPKPGDSVAYRDLADELEYRSPEIDTPLTVLHKFTLPLTEANELLRLLAVEGVDAASVFPGYQGVAQSLREMRLWPSL